MLNKVGFAALGAACLGFVAAVAQAGIGGQQQSAPPAHLGVIEQKPAASQVAAGGIDGAALYQARCAGCHENATDRIPSRETLSKNPASFILGTLRNGAMAPMAQGLSVPEMTAISRYVSKVKDDKTATQDIDPHLIWGDSVDGTPLDGPKCKGEPTPIDLQSKAQWQGWGNGLNQAHFQGEPGMAAGDVPKLKLKWAFQYAGAKNGQATIVGNRIFVTAMSGAVYSLDAKTGCVYWRHAAKAATRSSVTVVALPAGAPARHALFFSDWTKSAVALDADTGKQLWSTPIDDQPGMQMTGAPTYWDGKLFVPISSGNEAFAISPQWECCKFRGALVALNAVTGQVLWKRYTTEQVPAPFKKNSAGKQMFGPSGGAIWAAPTIDATRRLVYVGTSNSYTDMPYDNSDSVMAIEADTGKVRWAKQLLANDNYIDGCYRTPKPANCPNPIGPDFSIGASTILKDVGAGRQLLLVGQKSGMVYALDPSKNGEKVWEQRVGKGSALGGVEFGLAADETRVYAGVSDIVGFPRESGKPGLYALDIRTGAPVWSAPTQIAPKCRWSGIWCHGAVSQAVTVIPGIVFAGSYDGHFRAYDAATGKVVWDVDTGTDPVTTVAGKKAYGGVMDGSGPTVAGGMVFVHSGYAGRSGATGGRSMRNADGNVLMAFSVDGK